MVIRKTLVEGEENVAELDEKEEEEEEEANEEGARDEEEKTAE